MNLAPPRGTRDFFPHDQHFFIRGERHGRETALQQDRLEMAHRVAQLPHVAWPVMLVELLRRRRRGRTCRARPFGEAVLGSAIAVSLVFLSAAKADPVSSAREMMRAKVCFMVIYS